MGDRSCATATAVSGIDTDDSPRNDNAMIYLVSSDGARIPIARSAAMQYSELCKTTLEGDSYADEMPLYHIAGDIAQKIVDYLNYHQRVPPRMIEKPIQSNNMRDLVDRWDSEFVELNQDTLFRLLLAANYLNIKPLLQLCCAKVATLIKGKTPDQIRATFNIRNDFTAAEEEEIRREHKDLIG